MTTPLREACRALASCGASVVLGGGFGWLAAIGGAAGGAVEFGVMAGAAIGLLMSIALVFALERGPWFAGLAIIGLPTGAVAFLAGRFSPAFAQGVISIVVPACFYAAACTLYAIDSRRRWPRPRRGLCRKCGYSRHGLSAQAVCPECGTSP